MHNFPHILVTNHSFTVVNNYVKLFSCYGNLKNKTNLLSIIKLLSVTYHIKNVIWQTTFLSNKGIISLMIWPSSDKFPHTYNTPWNCENLDKMTVKLSPRLIAKTTYPSPRDLSMRKNEWFLSWTSAIKHRVHKS